MPSTQTALFNACRGRDALRRARAEAARPVMLQWLRKDGAPSKMHGAAQRCATVEQAMAQVAYLRSLNPNRPIRFAIDGQEV